MSLNGGTALIGANGDDDNELNSGSAYLLDTFTGDLLHKLTAPDGANNDQFGGSVAISGGTALIGAHFDDDNGSGSGSAYLFTIEDTAVVLEPLGILGTVVVLGFGAMSHRYKGK